MLIQDIHSKYFLLLFALPSLTDSDFVLGAHSLVFSKQVKFQIRLSKSDKSSMFRRYVHPTSLHFLHFALMSCICPTFWQFVLVRATVLHFDDISVRNILHCQIHSRRSNLVEIFRGFRVEKLIKSLCHSLFCYTVIWMLRKLCLGLSVVDTDHYSLNFNCRVYFTINRIKLNRIVNRDQA